MKTKGIILSILLLTLTILLVSCDFNNKNILSKDILFVHYIDVGQGDSILIQANNKNLLIDSGPNKSKDKLFSYLESQKIKKLDYVIATHPHEDHIGNMYDIIKKYRISEFFAPKIEHTTKSFEKMVEALVMKDLKIKVIKAGITSINLGKDIKTTVVAPTKDNYGDNKNNFSPIIKIQFGSNSFLFTGDAEKDSESDVLKEGFDIEADVLKIGHHGSKTSTSPEFLKKVNPSIAVISLAKDNKYNHPNKETIDLLNSSKITILRTDIHSNIVLSSNGTSIKKH